MLAYAAHVRGRMQASPQTVLSCVKGLPPDALHMSFKLVRSRFADARVALDRCGLLQHCVGDPPAAVIGIQTCVGPS